MSDVSLDIVVVSSSRGDFPVENISDHEDGKRSPVSSGRSSLRVEDFLKTYAAYHFPVSQPMFEEDFALPNVHSDMAFTAILEGTEFFMTLFPYPIAKQLVMLRRHVKRVCNMETHEVEPPSLPITENPVSNISTSSTTAPGAVGLVDVLSCKECCSDDVLGEVFGLKTAISAPQSLSQHISYVAAGRSCICNLETSVDHQIVELKIGSFSDALIQLESA